MTIREAASVILLRRVAGGAGGFEVLLMRRRAGSSFMAQAYVFPGGACDDDEDAPTAAARELFEEAGVLLARDAQIGAHGAAETFEAMRQDVLRSRMLDGEPAAALLASAGLAWWTEALAPWSHWVTPSIEKKRFSARFFVIELPSGQLASCDARETSDLVWVTPANALERSAELRLPPPQVRTCWELAQVGAGAGGRGSIEDVLALAKQRAREPHPIMPRLAASAGAASGPMLLLPWDPAYVDGGTGDSAPMTMAARPSWATGPSRFAMEDGAWRHIAAPS